ncbi:MAG: hypothetical protein Q9170_003538 [Blastenia crenularia]
MPTEDAQCSHCSLPTHSRYAGAKHFTSGDDNTTLDQNNQLQDPPTSSQLLQSEWNRIITPQATRMGYVPMGPPPWITPPLSSKSITPTSHFLARPVRAPSDASLHRVFLHYNSRTEEKKPLNQVTALQKTQPAITTAHHDDQSSYFLLSVSWHGLPPDTAALPPQAQISSCFLNPKTIVQDHRSLLDNSRFDEVLDGNAPIVTKSENSKRKIEDDHLENLQISCRRLCTLLYVLSCPEKSTIKYTAHHTTGLPRLVSAFVRQLCHKATALWEDMFDHLRSWVFGRRDKTSFSRNKTAVATSLARLFNCVKTYGDASTDSISRVTARVPFFIIKLTMAGDSDTEDELQQGIEMKSFDTETKRTPTSAPVVQLSVNDAGYPAETIRHVLFTLRFGASRSCKPLTKVTNSHESTLFHILGGTYPDRSSLQQHHLGSTPPEASSSSQATQNNAWEYSPFDARSSAAPLFSEDLRAFIESTPDPAFAQECKQEAEKHLSYQQNQLKEMKRRVRELEEEIHVKQVILGIADPPKHTLFDEVLPMSYPVRDGVASAGATTLVDAGGDAIYQPSASRHATELPVPESSWLGIGEDCDLPDDDVYMDGSTTLHQGPGQEPHGMRKRKNSTVHTNPKRIRGDSRSRKNDEVSPTQDHDSQPTFQSSHADLPMKPSAIDDGLHPPRTSRPSSWPRRQLFRRSAGISVKKLTEVFKKISLQQDRS